MHTPRAFFIEIVKEKKSNLNTLLSLYNFCHNYLLNKFLFDRNFLHQSATALRKKST